MSIIPFLNSHRNEMSLACILHQTERIDQHPEGWAGLTNVVSVSATDLLTDPDWPWHVAHTGGSVTFQHRIDARLVAKVFIDHNAELAGRYQLQLNGTPIVVGLELTHMSPGERAAVRDCLRRNFTYYMNPLDAANPRPKTALMPQDDHCLDVIFLEEGPCDWPVSEEMWVDTWEKLREQIGLEPGTQPSSYWRG